MNDLIDALLKAWKSGGLYSKIEDIKINIKSY